MARVELEALDLDDPASIDAFAARFLASGPAAPPPRQQRRDHGDAARRATRAASSRSSRRTTSATSSSRRGSGRRCAAANGARVVALSSRGHARAGVDFEDPHFERRPYDKWIAYGQSKTANALFAVALDARGEAHRVRAFSVHPGAIITELVAVDVGGGAARRPSRRARSAASASRQRAGRGDERVVRDEPAARRHGRRLLRGRRHRRGRARGLSRGRAACGRGRWIRSSPSGCGRRARRGRARPFPEWCCAPAAHGWPGSANPFSA